MQDTLHAVKAARPGARLVSLLVAGLALAAAVARAGAPIEYTPGLGARLGDTGLTLGGYSNLNLARDEGHPAQLSLDDVALFVTWDPTPRLHLFSELEFEDLLELDDHGHGHGGTNNWDFLVERLYGDFTLLDWLTVRVGKFLTPVGRWNVIHAQPLVWTTSRPLATELPFDPHTTGAMLFGSLYPRTGTVTYALYGQLTDQFEERPRAQLADRSGGARLEYEAPGGLSVGGSSSASTCASGASGATGAPSCRSTASRGAPRARCSPRTCCATTACASRRTGTNSTSRASSRRPRSSGASVKRYVATDRRAVGYIEAREVDASVRVVVTLASHVPAIPSR